MSDTTSSNVVHFIWRTLVAAFITAFITLALAGLLGGAQRSLAHRVDSNTAKILNIISTNSASRSASIDALFCIMADGTFNEVVVDTCLMENGVPKTYEPA